MTHEEGAPAEAPPGDVAPPAPPEQTPQPAPRDPVPAPPDQDRPKAAAAGSAEDAVEQEKLDGYADSQAARQDAHQIFNANADFNGLNAFGNGLSLYVEQWINGPDGSRGRVLNGQLGEERVLAEQRCYHPVADYAAMRSTLLGAHVLALVDQPDQGRRTTAKILLADCVGPSAVRLLIAVDVSLEQIYEDASKLFADGNGYLLDLRDRRADPQILEALSQHLAGRGAYLVIVGNAAAPGEHRPGPYTFPHPCPPPLDVLRNHVWSAVEQHLPRCTTCTTERMSSYLDKCLADGNFVQQLEFKTPPRVMAGFAEVLATGMHAGEEPEALLGRLPNRLRDEVEKTLREPELQPDEPHRASQRQAVLISFAVFHGRALTDVFETSGLLCQQILPRFESRPGALNQAVFDSNLKQLISDDMRDSTLLRADDGPRRAKFVSPALSGIVLDVAWHDFASTRDPIIMWLDALAGHDRVAIQVRAAQVAGLLATFDFDEIYRKLIGVWARSSARYRESAALAFEIASFDERLLGRTRDRVEAWAASPSPRLQDSAVRAYGTRIGATIPNDAVRALRKLARKAELAETNAIGVALARLFAADAAEQVLDALGEWIASDVEYVRRHAVRALLLLARFSLSSANAQVPALPGVVAEREQWQDSLVELWRGALVGTETSHRAWESLRRWLVAAESDEALAVVEPLALRVFARPLDVRAAFHLDLWSSRTSDSTVLQRLRKAVGRGRP
ncbi:serine/threonine-protein kinase [Saccharothrix stipae]